MKDNLEEVISNHIAAGVTRLTIDTASPPIVGKGVSVEDTLDPHELAVLIDRAYRELEGHKVAYSFNVTMPLCVLDQELKRRLQATDQLFNSCHIPSGSGLVFDNEGNILPCNHFPSYPLGKFGVEFTDRDSFLEFWSSEGVREFRKACQRYPHKKCKSCEEWDICGGGCILKWLHYNPADFIL